MSKPNNKKNKSKNNHLLKMVSYDAPNIEKQVLYSEEEKKQLQRSLADDSKKYLDTELANKLKKKDPDLYKVLYSKIPNTIQNYDFYTAFRNVKINELINPVEEKHEGSHFKFPGSLIFYDESRYKKSFINKRVTDPNYQNRKYTDKEMYCVDWPNTIAVFAFLFLCIFLPTFGGIVSCVIDNNLEQGAAKISGIAILEVILLVMIIRIFKKRRIKKSQEIKTQKSNHPYYNICDNLHYYSIRFTHILYPVNQIEEKYRKSKKAIEKEWTKYSENAFTNILFRFKPINVYVNFDYKLRLFIEIDYKECFPDYPELLNIEQQTEPFIQNLLSYYRYDEPIYPYKTRIKDYITELLSDRMPDMIVKDITVAIVKSKLP